MNLLYISFGNIPSKWAHTFQMMKMAEAFAKRISHCSLVTRLHWKDYFKPRFDYFGWYGIQHVFPIVRLPVAWHQASPVFKGRRCHFPYFNRFAALYATLTRPDIVYTRSLHTARLTVQLGLPTILEMHINSDDHAVSHLTHIKNNSKLLGVVTISNVLRDRYVASVGVPKEKIIIAPDAVDLAPFDISRNKVELRKQLNLPEDSNIITYSGHLYQYKGVGTVIECARQLPECLFVLVGGWEQDILRCKQQAQGLKNVFFVGFVSNKDIPKYLLASDILLLPNSARHPSAQYTSPMKLFEYMAACKPIIASDIPALDTILHHGENAWLFEPDSADALALAINHLLDNSELCDRLARNAYRDVQEFTWDKRAEMILERFLPDYRIRDAVTL